MLGWFVFHSFRGLYVAECIGNDRCMFPLPVLLLPHIQIESEGNVRAFVLFA